MNSFPLILGIESSCDETAVALVRGDRTIVAQAVASQDAAHRPFGGVLPEIAARAHVEVLTPMIERVLAEGGVRLADVDAIAATAGPGLIGGVMVGLVTAKALALAAGKSLIAVNHLEAHGLSARLSEGLEFPFMLLLVSGGHCQLLGVEGVGRFRLYGTTIDDAAGEAFDKTAKLLGLAYPGGPRIEALAREGNPKRYKLPRPLAGREGADFSFSGLKTAVRQVTLEGDVQAADLAASFQAAVIDILRDRTKAAMAMFVRDFPQTAFPAFVMGGGVAANGAIRAALGALASAEGFALKVPPPALCTDNAAMIAWAGIERAGLGLFDPLNVAARARWPLESL